MQLSPLHLRVAGLLSGRLFRIPDYQRAYAWGPRQREDLFDDIRSVKKSGREHFMATVVALARESRLIGADQFRVVEIVDGQQRITTLIILLKAIEKALSEKERVQSRVKREISELLIKDDEHSLLLLQTNHDASSVFVDYMVSGDINQGSAKTAADINIVDAARECEKFVEDWLDSSTLVDLLATIRNQLSVIYHELTDEATVYSVFEVLNSRGLDVKWIDKLKSQLMSLIFEHVDQGTRVEAAHQMQTTWRDIYRTLGLKGSLGDEALRFTGTWARSNRPNRIISQEDATQELTVLAGTTVKSIASVGTKLKLSVNAMDDLDQNVRLRAVTRISHARFVAAAIIIRNFEPDIRAKLLGRWERVTFTIYGLGGLDSRTKVGDYVRLGYKIGTSDMTPAEIETSIASLGSDFNVAEIVARPHFWDNSYENWTEELRYLLYRYDEFLSEKSGSPFNDIQWNKIWADEPTKSIEHIKPQSSNATYVHNIGNLTMLPPRLNSSLQDKSPEEKASSYRKSGLQSTTDVGDLIESGLLWNEAAVNDRANEIADFMAKEWSK